MLFFKNATRFFAVACVVIGAMLVIMSCDGAESELRSMDAERQSLTTPTSISSDQASHTEPTATKTPTAEKQIVPGFTVNSPVVNVRQGPGTNFAVIDQVTQGEKFKANGKNQPGDWIRFCCVGGDDGWIYKELITIENEHLLSVVQVIPTLSPTPQPESSPTPQTAPSPTPKPTQSSQVGNDPLAGIQIAPENRCSPYHSEDYSYSQSVEPRIIASMGGAIYSPYTGQHFQNRGKTDIEHIVARSEAHDSGLCGRDAQTRKNFAGDLINLTLASPALNRHEKSDKDIADWLPELNQCWFVKQVVAVKRTYSLSMDEREAETARRIWANCSSFEMLVYARAAPAPLPTPTLVPDEALVEQDWLARCDSNGNGRITCAEAGACGLSRPVPSSHPAYQHMRDGDGDGQVCD